MNSESENLICDGPNMSANEKCVSENVLPGIMESNLDYSEANVITTPLDDILQNVYDLHPNAKDFRPGFNSTMSENQIFNAGINSVANNFNINFSNDASLYVSAQSNSATDSSIYITPMLHSTADYQSSSSLSYPLPSENPDYMEYLVSQKMYNMGTASTTMIQEEDNDPSPVYLNFNLQNMSQPSQTINTELEKISNQMANHEAENKNETINYVEFTNDLEESTVHAKFVDTNIQRNEIFRQLTTNMITPALSKCLQQQTFDVSQDIEGINANNMIEVSSTYPPLNNTLTNIIEFQRPELNFRRNIISRQPLQTKLTIKRNQKNRKWALNNNNDIIENPNEMCNVDFTSIENIAHDIPFVRYRPRIRGRKQKLDVLTESEISFMNTKGEFSAFSAEQVSSTSSVPYEPKHPIIDNSFVTFRKKMKPIETYTEPIEEMPIKASTRNRNFQKSNRLDTTTINGSITANSVNTLEISRSSDTESEDDDIQANEIKCLKCNNCKKMFKTARSYSIHKKRCDAPGFAENTYVTEVEYLESDKENEIEPISSPEKYEPRPKRTLTVHKKSIAESDSIELLDIPENITESDRNYEYVTRRNTRSSQKTLNSITTLSSSSTANNASPIRSKKPRNAFPNPVTNKTLNRNILSCAVCHKKFRQKSYLIAHKRIHDKHYKCQYCFKTFEIKAAYDTHVMDKCEKIPAVELKKLRLAVGSN